MYTTDVLASSVIRNFQKKVANAGMAGLRQLADKVHNQE